MEIPKDLLKDHFCKWEEKYFQEFNLKLAERGMSPITYDEYFKLLMDAGKEDDWMAPTPRIR
jgi:hypothetical protein